MIGNAASKIPWEKFLKVALPVIIDEIKKLVAKMRKRESPKTDPNLTPEARINKLEIYVQQLEQDLKEAVEALEKTATELSALASAGRVLTARITTSLVVSGSAAILAIGCCIFVFLHR